MSKDIFTPQLGESISEATIAEWLKKPGDTVRVDEPLVILETDKVTVEVPSPVSGTLKEVLAEAGSTVAVGALLGRVEEGVVSGAAPAAPRPTPVAPVETPATAPTPTPAPTPAASAVSQPSPAAKKIAAEKSIPASAIDGTGKGGRITKADALAASGVAGLPAPEGFGAHIPGGQEERVRMTRLRLTIAKRLKEAQNTAAMLTTFNEIDMTAAMALRKKYKEPFEKRHGVRLGFMSMFARACVAALRDVPEVNAQIDGEEIVYRDYYNIGVAVGTERGLIVPVLRNVQNMSLADIEKTTAAAAAAARDGKLELAALQGGSFTISNGGVYGSLLSTPILNFPQAGILGMHKIEKRAVVVEDEIVIRPMMYVALSYDHRLVDGKQAVTFLVRVKEGMEDPARLVLDV